ncbi:MarR family winged helix-turn-helix transcriptional regulator [Umezawaea sp.]|uniref:MarR family winged helix-turn-helix transcriptional regulator n=1 Tax=Umezawaea sp. TaxID=1955258 RepID=UPI002ED4557C
MDTPRALTPPEEDLWRAFARVLNVLPRVIDVELQTKANITAPEYVALSNLGDARPDGLRISELAARVGLSASRVSRLADSLVRRGEVDRHQDPDDARGHRLTITDAGLTRIEAAWPHQVDSVRRNVLDHVDEADYEVLTRTLRAIVE